MDAHALGQFGNADFRGSLDFLKQPHLRAGKAATGFKLTKILAHGSIDNPELLQDFKGELRWGVVHGKIVCAILAHKLYCQSMQFS